MATLIAGMIQLYKGIPYSLVGLLGRIVIGLVFYRSFLTKVDLASWTIKPQTFVLFANEYKVPLLPPEVAAYIATATEFVCPILLWLGLATRLSATALLAMTLVIQIFVYPNAYMTHGLWAIALLMLMRFGPGRISLDHLLKRHYLE